jgi:hypothetical protein
MNGKASINWAAGGGTAQAQTAAFSPAPTSLVDGLPFCWKPAAANTAAAPTFSPDGLTAHPIVKAGGAALAANDLTTTAHACVIYNLASTDWELQNPQTGGGVPYTGATGDVDLGTHKITASEIDISGSGPTLMKLTEGTEPSSPTTPATGELYQDSADHHAKLKLASGTVIDLSGGGGTPGGSTGQMQVNSSGSFAGQGFALSGGGSAVWQRATECATGTVSLSGGTWTYPGGTVAAAAATSQEIPIITGLNGGVRYSRVLLSEHVIFASSTVTVTKASIGRPGTTDDEMLPQTSMMVSSGDAWFAEDRPQTPILGVSNTYSLVLAIRTTGGNVSALTTGAASYEVCAYAGL